jgi:predicted DNA-binding transcriptional regulator AlpA
VGLSIRAQRIVRERALAKQAERQARLREAEKAAAEFNAEYLTPAAAAHMTGFSVGRLRRLNAEGRGPRPLKLGQHRQSRIRYPRSEVVAWLADRDGYEAETLAAGRTKFSPPPAAVPSQ